MTDHVVFARPVNLTEERVQEMLVKRAKQQAFKEMLDEQIMEAQHSRERSKNNSIHSNSSKAEHVSDSKNGSLVSRKLFPASKSSAQNGEGQMLSNGHSNLHQSKNKLDLANLQRHSSLKESKLESIDHEQLSLQGTKLTTSTSMTTATTENDKSNNNNNVSSDPTTNVAVNNNIANMSGSRSRRANDVAIKFINAPPTRYIFNFENGHGEFIEEKNNADSSNNNANKVDGKPTSVHANNVTATGKTHISGNALNGSNNRNAHSNIQKANEVEINSFNMQEDGAMSNDRAKRERKSTKCKEEKQGTVLNSASNKVVEQEYSDITSHDYNSLPISFDAKSALMENSNKRGVVRLVNTKNGNHEDASHDTQSLPINLLYQLNKGEKDEQGEVANNAALNRKKNNEHVLINHVMENKLFADGASNRKNGNINVNVDSGESNTLGRDLSGRSSGKESLPRHKLVHSPLRVDKSKEISPRTASEDVTHVAQSKEMATRQHSSQTSLSPHHRLQHLNSPMVSARSHVESKLSDGAHGLSSRNRISPRRNNGRPANGILPPITMHPQHYSAQDNYPKSNETKHISNLSPSPSVTMNANTNTSTSERSESEGRMVIELSAELESVSTNSPINEVISSNNNNNNSSDPEVKEVVKSLGNKQEPSSVVNGRGNASPVPGSGVNQVVRLQRALQSREAMVEKMRLKEKSWEEQVKQLKVELRNARQKERHLSRHIAGQKPLPQLNKLNPPVRRAETAPDGSDLTFDAQLPHPHPPSSFLRPRAPQSTSTSTSSNTNTNISSSSHPVSVNLPGRIKAGQLPLDLCERRGRVKLDFTKAHIFTPDTFRPITAPDFPEEVSYISSFTNPPHPPLKPSMWEQQRTFTISNTLSLATPSPSQMAPAQPITSTTSPSEPSLTIGISKANRGKPHTRKAVNPKLNHKDNVNVINTEITLQEYEYDDDDDEDEEGDIIKTTSSNSSRRAHESQSSMEHNRKRHVKDRESWLSVDDSFKLASLNTQQTALGLPRDAAMRPVPIEFKHLLQFVEAQVITHEQATKLWQFWCETKLVNKSYCPTEANEHAIGDPENNQNVLISSSGDKKEDNYDKKKKKLETEVTNNVKKDVKIGEENENEKETHGVLDPTKSELSGNKAKTETGVHANQKEMEFEELLISSSSSSEEEEEEEEEEWEEEESEEWEEEEADEDSEEEDLEKPLSLEEQQQEKEKKSTTNTEKHLQKNGTTNSAKNNGQKKTDGIDANDVFNQDSNIFKKPLNRNVIFTPALRQKIDSKFVSNDCVIQTKRNSLNNTRSTTEFM